MADRSNVIQLRPTPLSLHPVGRLIRCSSCGADVDVIEIDLGGTGSSMRADRCGDCHGAPAAELRQVS